MDVPFVMQLRHGKHHQTSLILQVLLIGCGVLLCLNFVLSESVSAFEIVFRSGPIFIVVSVFLFFSLSFFQPFSVESFALRTSAQWSFCFEHLHLLSLRCFFCVSFDTDFEVWRWWITLVGILGLAWENVCRVSLHSLHSHVFSTGLFSRHSLVGCICKWLKTNDCSWPSGTSWGKYDY